MYAKWFQTRRFVCDPYINLWKTCESVADHFWSYGHNFNKISRSLLADATYEITRLYAKWFRTRRFVCDPYINLWKTCESVADHFWSYGHNFNKISRSLLADATYEITRLYAKWFRTRRFVCDPYINLWKTCESVADHFWSYGHNFNKISRSLLADATYEITRLYAKWFRTRRFVCDPYINLWKTCESVADHFWSYGHNFNKISRSLLADATYEITRLYAKWFRTRRFVCDPYINLWKTCESVADHFWSYGHNFKRISRSLLDDATYQITRLYAKWFLTRRFVCVPYINLRKPCESGAGHFFNKISRGLLDDATYQITGL